MYASMESERGGVSSVRFPSASTCCVSERCGLQPYLHYSHSAAAVTPHPAVLRTFQAVNATLGFVMAAATSTSKCRSSGVQAYKIRFLCLRVTFINNKAITESYNARLTC